MAEKIGVVGSGQMGHGIAEVFALAGYNVTVSDVSFEILTKAKSSVSASLDRMVKSQKITQQKKDELMGMISFTTSLKDCAADSMLIVEAIPEVLEMKKNLFSSLENFAPQDCIIASNSSNIRITEIASSMKNPSRALGLHFFNPPVVLKLVEVIKGEKTSDEVFERAFELVKKIGKVPIRVLKDSPGFVVNRVNAPESLFFCLLVEKMGYRPEDVDAFAKGQGLPMGPYELMDYVGLDTLVHSLDYFAKELSPDYGSCKAFHNLVSQNRLGLKSGQGFYLWENGKAKIPQPSGTTDLTLMDIFAIEVNEASRIVEEGIASPADIETGVKLGMNRPFGPISVAEGLSVAEIREKLGEIYRKTGLDVFKPSKSIENGTVKDAFSGKVAKPKGAETGSIASAEPAPAGDGLLNLVFDGNVAIIRLSNGKNNLLNAQVLDQLESAIDRVVQSGNARSILIEGSGEVFSAGAELSQFFPGVVDFMNFSRRGQDLFERISTLRIPSVAAIDGYALGGGFELALACDIRISTERAKIGFPEVTRGIIPGWGGTQRLPRLIGESLAAYLILTADRITGKRAHEMGIVSLLATPETLEQTALSIARNIAENCAPVSERLAKELIHTSLESSLHVGLEKEATAMGVLYGTDDIKEGVGAFLQKRKVEFKGK